MEYINKKNKKKYTYFGTCVNATNKANNELMVLYVSEEGEWYVRETKEFNEKFEPDN